MAALLHTGPLPACSPATMFSKFIVACIVATALGQDEVDPLKDSQVETFKAIRKLGPVLDVSATEIADVVDPATFTKNMKTVDGMVSDYAADFSAYGVDATFGLYGFGLRSYFYSSTEDLSGGAPVGELARSGFTLEPSYTLKREADRFKEIVLLARLGQADEETLVGTTLRRSQLGLGANIQLTHTFVGKVGYISQGEDEDLPDIDNNAFNFSFTYEF